MMSEITVIMPAFNAEAYISEAVASVQNQTFSDWELLIVDDGSMDRTAEIINLLAAKDNRIRVFHHEDGANKGVSASRYLALKQASGQYVAFLDADDAFFPDKLEKQMAYLESHPGVILVHGRAQPCFEDPGLEHDNFYFRFADHNLKYHFHERFDAFTRNVVCNSTILVRTGMLRKVMKPLPQLFQTEDWLLWMLLSQEGLFAYVNEESIKYRVHTGSATANLMRNRLRERFAYLEFLASYFTLGKECMTDEMRKRFFSAVEMATKSILQAYAAECEDVKDRYWSNKELYQPFEPMLARKLSGSVLLREFLFRLARRIGIKKRPLKADRRQKRI